MRAAGQTMFELDVSQFNMIVTIRFFNGWSLGAFRKKGPAQIDHAIGAAAACRNCGFDNTARTNFESRRHLAPHNTRPQEGG
jgi:hypothetical protein